MLVYAVVLIAVMLFNWSPKMIEWRKMVAAKFKAQFGRKKTVGEAEGGAQS